MSDNAPITEELRDAMQRYDNFDGTGRVVLGESNFDRLCDAIDATHANLERENTKLRELVRDMWPSYCYANSGCETFLTEEQDVAIRERVRRLKVINK